MLRRSHLPSAHYACCGIPSSRRLNSGEVEGTLLQPLRRREGRVVHRVVRVLGAEVGGVLAEVGVDRAVAVVLGLHAVALALLAGTRRVLAHPLAPQVLLRVRVRVRVRGRVRVRVSVRVRVWG